MRKLKRFAGTLAAAALIWAAAPAAPKSYAGDRPAYSVAFKTAVEPKALSATVKRGLEWLAKHQLENGAWGQGDESVEMGRNSGMGATASVADTSMAMLAFYRAGENAKQGEYKNQVRRGLEYVLHEVETSDKDSLYVTQVRGTRVQGKIGTYVDTFTALMILTEAKGTMPDQAGNARLDQALSKVLAKIEKNQQKDGTWANQGWAPALTQSIAAKGLNRAAQSGEKVAAPTLQRVEAQAQNSYDAKSGAFAGGGTAGVDLYGAASSTSAMRDSANTRGAQEEDLKKKIAEAKTPDDKARYTEQLNDGKRAQDAAHAAEKALVTRVEDPSFMRGFGNNGGEEFLSYMLMSEALVVKGGADWQKWDVAITKLVNGVQNQDGSWTGHHCITGRTFCTAAALLVLMADRTPVPTASKLRG